MFSACSMRCLGGTCPASARPSSFERCASSRHSFVQLMAGSVGASELKQGLATAPRSQRSLALVTCLFRLLPNEGFGIQLWPGSGGAPLDPGLDRHHVVQEEATCRGPAHQVVEALLRLRLRPAAKIRARSGLLASGLWQMTTVMVIQQ